MSDCIFSVYVDIDDQNLDNPGDFDRDTGEQKTTTKSLTTKAAMKKYAKELESRQRAYAESIGAGYYLITNDDPSWDHFVKYLHPFGISVYDIVNFFKHNEMFSRAYNYGFDRVCYLDFDVIPNTTESIFDAHRSPGMHIAHQNDDAEWGKLVPPSEYTTCIRNPASKYWNAHAMLTSEFLEGDNDVFNTGIMVADRETILKLNYMGGFEDALKLMTELKNDPDSMYPPNIQRVFNYDNETLFSYLIQKRGIKVNWMDDQWHSRVDQKGPTNPEGKMLHMINKRFGDVL